MDIIEVDLGKSAFPYITQEAHLNQRSIAMTLRISALLFAFSMIRFATGCDGETGEPVFPNHEQVGQAVDALLADPGRDPPDALGPAIDEKLFSREETPITDTLAPPDESVPELFFAAKISVSALKARIFPAPWWTNGVAMVWSPPVRQRVSSCNCLATPLLRA